MDLIKSIPVGHGRLELWVGDLASLTADDGADLLVVSAFAGDYEPTETSLIGALDRRGLSVGDLALDPEEDLRAASFCWLSRRIPDGRERFGIDRVLCYEPMSPSVAGTVVGEIFRAMVPFVGSDWNVRDVAMPILASGDQGQDQELMFAAMVDAASSWMRFGLQLERLRFVVRDTKGIAPILSLLEQASEAPRAPSTRSNGEASVFLSYARKDGTGIVDEIHRHLEGASIETFMDRADLEVGSAWQGRLAAAIEGSRKVVLVLTPGYCKSVNCLEEFGLARVVHEQRGDVLHPLLVLGCDLPEHVARFTHVNCTEGDLAKVRAACDELVSSLGSHDQPRPQPTGA